MHVIMNYLKTLTLFFGILVLVSCSQDKTAEFANNAIVYSGGDILTMKGDSPSYADAIVVKDNKILFVGSWIDAKSKAGEGYKYEDLKGNHYCLD